MAAYFSKMRYSPQSLARRLAPASPQNCEARFFVDSCKILTRILLAPHTSGPRDVPRCGALSLLQKDAALQGGIQQKSL
jgi:hypothetical protein